MTPETTTDVFISYNSSRDHVEATAIAHRLRGNGVSVFFDRWHLHPGRSWPEALERHLAGCRNIAILLGPGDLGRWQQREKYLAMARRADDAGFGVIPVLLPGAEMPTGFLTLETWVDLRDGVSNELALSLLEAGIRGKAPEALLEQSRVVRSGVCPYRGLEVFREEDAAFFFGRSSFTQRLIEAVGREPVVAVVGPSGSGKSSVVRAGLVPALRKHDGGRVWEVLTLVPGRNPWRSLAGLLVPIVEPDPDRNSLDKMVLVNETLDRLEQGTLHVHQLVEGLFEKQPGTERLLLVVDQWEELYTYEPENQAERKLFRQKVDQFVEALFAVTRLSNTTIVLTLRADFYKEALRHRKLADAMSAAQVNLAPLNAEELAEIIKLPADAVNLKFEDGLTELLQADVGDEPGNLALLEFALRELWERRKGQSLYHEAYQAIGRVSGALASRAEQVYQQLDATQQDRAQRLFRLLVRPGEENRDTRRRAKLNEFNAQTQYLVRDLAGPKARLLVVGNDDAGKVETVEVAHEALLREWPRLRGWIDEQRQALRQRDKVTTAARDWDQAGRPEALLWRHEVLDPARHSLADADLLPDLERDAKLAEFLHPEAERLLEYLHYDAIEHTRREIIGMRLSEIGDPRRGTGVIDGVPDILWQRISTPMTVTVSTRERVKVRVRVRNKFSFKCFRSKYKYEYQYRDSERIYELQPFEIAVYPITYAQYQAFINAPDGYDSDDWWQGLKREGKPAAQLQKYASYPADNVSAYDATAFCRWLSRKLDLEVQLPKKRQWEWAARSARANFVYPWGTDWEDGLCNTRESGLGRTTAVGMYPAGRSKQQIYDLAGNVREWCVDIEDEAPNTSGKLSGKFVLRGGCWDDNRRIARADYTFAYHPYFRNNFSGFRVVLTPPNN